MQPNSNFFFVLCSTSGGCIPVTKELQQRQIERSSTPRLVLPIVGVSHTAMSVAHPTPRTTAHFTHERKISEYMGHQGFAPRSVMRCQKTPTAPTTASTRPQHRLTSPRPMRFAVVSHQPRRGVASVDLHPFACSGVALFFACQTSWWWW